MDEARCLVTESRTFRRKVPAATGGIELSHWIRTHIDGVAGDFAAAEILTVIRKPNGVSSIGWSFRLLDPESAFQPQVLNHLVQLRRHALGERRAEGYGQFYVDLQSVTSPQFWQHPGAQAVPHLRGDGAYQTEGASLGTSSGRGCGCRTRCRFRP